MKHERSWLVALAMSGAMVLGLSTESSAVFDHDDGYSYTQPGAELVMPYDTADGRATFLVASNISGEQVSTHWIFWAEDCNEAVNFSICLTPNDTVVVDPRNMSAINADNERIGPEIMLSGQRGIVTVVAYETDSDCSPFNESTPIADDTIVGAFTFADTTDGYSFGNDAMALGTDINGAVQVPHPSSSGFQNYDFEFALQTFNPTTVDTSVVVLAHLREWSDRTVRPNNGVLRFSTSFIDNTEIPTSLPDTTVQCTEFYSIADDLIPPTTTVETSGIIRLQPQSGLVNGTDYLYGIVGQSVLRFGASSSVKVEQVPGSASPAFVDGLENGLF